MSNIKTQTGKMIGRSLNAYHSKIKPKIDELKFKESYQNRLIDCMIGEVDDNYIEIPETDAPIVKLEHSKDGFVKVSSVKGKTILVDANGNRTDVPTEGCKLMSVGEAEDNKIIILSKNKNLFDGQWVVGKGLDATTGTEFENSERNITNFIRVKENTVYKISGATFGIIRCYDKHKNVIGGLVNNTTPSRTEYIRCAINNTCDYSKFQIEENNVVTTYVEPKSHKAEILLDEPLRSLPNGVCDEIVGNQLIRRVGVRIKSNLAIVNEAMVNRDYVG